MFDFANTDFRRIATALVGAAVLSTVSLAAAVGPARAATPAATNAWKADVENQLSGDASNLRQSLSGNDYAIATVLVNIDAAGRIKDAQVTRSTGSDRLDKQALDGALQTRFPATPSGKPVHVEMNLVFGRTERAIELGRAALARPVAYASKTVDGSSNFDGRVADKAGM